MVRALITLTFLFGSFAKAEVLFEGYSSVFSGGVHVGFTVSRYEYDAKKKLFTSVYLMKTNDLGGNITESLKAVAKDDLSPVSYEYTTLAGGQPKLIDAKFSKGKMSATVKEGNKVTQLNRDIPKGTFLSTFLVYVMLKGPKGLAVDVKYDYQAIAEEDGSIVKGAALIKSQEEQNGVKTFKVLNDFKDTKFIAMISEKGEVLSTKAPVISISTELVPQSSQATAGFPVPSALLTALFGEVPLGVANEISKKYQNNPKAFHPTEGVAAGSSAAPETGK